MQINTIFNHRSSLLKKLVTGQYSRDGLQRCWAQVKPIGPSVNITRGNYSTLQDSSRFRFRKSQEARFAYKSSRVESSPPYKYIKGDVSFGIKQEIFPYLSLCVCRHLPLPSLRLRRLPLPFLRLRRRPLLP